MGRRGTEIGRPKSYEVIDIFELYEYDATCHGRGGLFVQYINKILEIKTEAS